MRRFPQDGPLSSAKLSQVTAQHSLFSQKVGGSCGARGRLAVQDNRPHCSTASSLASCREDGIITISTDIPAEVLARPSSGQVKPFKVSSEVNIRPKKQESRQKAVTIVNEESILVQVKTPLDTRLSRLNLDFYPPMALGTKKVKDDEVMSAPECRRMIKKRSPYALSKDSLDREAWSRTKLMVNSTEEEEEEKYVPESKGMVGALCCLETKIDGLEQKYHSQIKKLNKVLSDQCEAIDKLDIRLDCELQKLARSISEQEDIQQQILLRCNELIRLEQPPCHRKLAETSTSPQCSPSIESMEEQQQYPNILAPTILKSGAILTLTVLICYLIWRRS